MALGSATLVAIHAPQPTSPSRSEIALRTAHEDALRIAGLAHNAAVGGANPGTQRALSTAGTVLDRQAAVLGGTPPQATPGAATPTGPAVVGTAPVSPTPTPPAVGVTASAGAGKVEAKDVAAALASSVQARLAALPDVDAPTATLLASVAAGQSVQLDAIDGATGNSSTGAVPSPGPTPTTGPTPSPSASGPCPSPTATASYGGSGFPGALAAAERAESAAVYLLETAIARTPAGSPDAAARSSALDAHRRQLASVDSLAAAACTALPPRDAGFAVPPGFASDPSAALKAVEGSSEEAWAQLVGAASGARRSVAAGGLMTAAHLAAAVSPSDATAFPGVPTAQ
ncbi:hypothetical protein LK10_18805 [Sinomonas humi]|uniref:DUF4439 domain-containing protein n=1 Tax=Sinomonas humi TaxID=1338436 RepID=A0A0B2AB45_9MICC|nr:hypothetical protein LK10_18805 [Sinomonas humi]